MRALRADVTGDGGVHRTAELDAEAAIREAAELAARI